jgi:hypothetical protein
VKLQHEQQFNGEIHMSPNETFEPLLEAAVTPHEIPEPVQVLEVAVTGKTLVLRVNGASTYVSRHFPDPDNGRLGEIREAYFDLDRLARQSHPGLAYENNERKVGMRLKEILFRNIAGADRQLGDVLAECLSKVSGKDYVRLLLSFDNPYLGNLPWELTLWNQPGNDKQEPICLGRDPRIALSRLAPGREGVRRRHLLGRDHVLSILHIGIVTRAQARAGDADDGQTEYELTRDLLRLIDDHVTRLHATSRSSEELTQYWVDSRKITGRPAEMDIVHWDSHGGRTIQFQPQRGQIVDLEASALLRCTRNAFLYVVRACDAAGTLPQRTSCPEQAPVSFSAALLKAGAPVVLGTSDAVASKEFAYLPILYPLMLQGLPLDYCVQDMRRLFRKMNAEKKRPYDRWYKLVLGTGSACYLDAASSRAPLMSCSNPEATIDALRAKFGELEQTARARTRSLPDDYGTQSVPPTNIREDMNMPDQWDPKWPTNKSDWNTLYDEARPQIQEPSSAWHGAFAAIVAADGQGEFQYLRSFYSQSYLEAGVWVWRSALWELFCKPMFEEPQDQWPAYARLVYEAVPALWMDEDGQEEGIPESWLEGAARKKVWAFKATTLLIAGLVEEKLGSAPAATAKVAKAFVPANAQEPLAIPMTGSSARRARRTR